MYHWKQIICAFLAVTMLLCVVGCSSREQQTETTQATEPTQAPEDPVLTERREQVLAKMRQMQMILWRVEEPITYSKYGNSQGIETDDEDQLVTLEPGKIYRGIPYTHSSGSEQAFMDFAAEQDENGVYVIRGLETGDLSGQENTSIYTPRIGNDCADSVFWAWATVSTSISYLSTHYMTEEYGCIKVGDYATDFEEYSDTILTCQGNGQYRMYAAYAQLKGADAVVTAPTGAHAMMVSQVHVEYLDDGTIDGENSYILVVHQTAGNLFKGKAKYDERIGQDVYPSGGLDDQFTFAKLYEKGYLPVTIRELIDPAAIPAATASMTNAAPDLESMYTGSVKSNFRISHVTIAIVDAQGNTVQASTCYGREKEMYALDLKRFTRSSEQDSLRGILDVEALDAGTYTVEYTCHISTGESIPVGSFTFEK